MESEVPDLERFLQSEAAAALRRADGPPVPDSDVPPATAAGLRAYFRLVGPGGPLLERARAQEGRRFPYSRAVSGCEAAKRDPATGELAATLRQATARHTQQVRVSEEELAERVRGALRADLSEAERRTAQEAEVATGVGSVSLAGFAEQGADLFLVVEGPLAGQVWSEEDLGLGGAEFGPAGASFLDVVRGRAGRARQAAA